MHVTSTSWMEADTSDVTLALRGERISLDNVVSSVYNPYRHELLIVTPSALYVFGDMVTAGGTLMATLCPDEKAHYQFAIYLSWLEAYSVVVINASGGVEHQVVSSDLKKSMMSHVFVEKGGQFLTALANPHRRELLTADTYGGLKVWALRVVASAHTSDKVISILRMHTSATSSTKHIYRHVRMSFNGQKIFASTNTKVYVLDAASCNRLPCFIHEDHRVIFSMECGNNDDSVYLVFKATIGKVDKFVLSNNKGLPQFRKVGSYKHNQDIVAFAETKSITLDGAIVLIDIGEHFSVVDFSRQTSHEQQAMTLPYNPLTERYNALHANVVIHGRNFAFVVWSTGCCILELFFPDVPGRIPCNLINGERLQRIDNASNDSPISIYQRSPSMQVILFKRKIADFCSISLPKVTDPKATERGSENILPIVDYVVAADAVITLWPHGLVQKHKLSDNRVITIAQPLFASATTTASTITSLHFNGQDCVAIGDSVGFVFVFTLTKTDLSTNGLMTSKQAHVNDSVSSLVELNVESVDVVASLLSVSRAGEVKCWHIKRSYLAADNRSGETIVWELLACFRTHSPDVSTTMFEPPQFLFCGFDGGGVECWRLPWQNTFKASRRQRQATSCISVVKRALHAMDLHLSPVLSIVSELGAGTSVLASPLPADQFAWVFSYDENATIFIWCFSLDFFFPHRRIKINEIIKGIYISLSNGFLDLYAYAGRSIDRVDRLGSNDKEVVIQRLRRGREYALQRKLLKRNAGEGQASMVERHRKTDSTALELISVAAPHNSVSPSPTKAIDKTHKSAQTPLNDKQLEAIDPSAEVDCLRIVPGASPLRTVNQLSFPSMDFSSTVGLKLPRQFVRPLQRKRIKENEYGQNRVNDANAQDLPGETLLPSSFQHTRPRVYRKAVNPLDSIPSQVRCALVTAEEDTFTQSSSSPSFDKGEATLLDTVDSSTSTIAIQETVAVVSLVKDEDESFLLLDYQPGRQTTAPSLRTQTTKENEENLTPFSETLRSYPLKCPSLPWNRMSDFDRGVEIMAATKSKCIQRDAEMKRIIVPSVEDFASAKLSKQLRVRSFTRWFTASRHRQQQLRERFLMEELRFAAIDPVIHQELAHVGLEPLPIEQIGSETSTEWLAFVCWYTLGLTASYTATPPEVLQQDRLKARTEYLEMRLRIVAQSELEIQEEFCEDEDEPPQRVYIFEHFKKREPSDVNSSMSWENTSLENRQKEIMLALLDPEVQVAAMKNNVEIPDVSGFDMDDFDILATAGNFVSWWKRGRNIHRRNFLRREAHEAFTSKIILHELLSRERNAEGGDTVDWNEATGINNGFLKSYFRSDTVRFTFLKEKLEQRKNQIAKTLTVESEIESEKVDEAAKNQFKLEEKVPQQLEAQDDALSHGNNDDFEECVEETEEIIPIVPKRTDFLHSYFFGDLPINYRDIATVGWRSGSGVNNCDEEYDEEKQFQREREHQQILKQQEADKLAKMEQQVANESTKLEPQETDKVAKLELQARRDRMKERKKKALQFCRVRRVELMRVLMHQAALEAKRKVDLQKLRDESERCQMQREDEHSNRHRDKLLRDRIEKRLVNQLAVQLTKEFYEIALTSTRLQLREQALMLAEDQQSLRVRVYLQNSNREQTMRMTNVSEPYSPIHSLNRESRKCFLPQITRRLEEQYQQKVVKLHKGYTIPIAEELVLGELDQKPYVARDSRKFKLLMGLPLQTSSSHKERHRILNTDGIVALQQKQRHLVNVEGDGGQRLEMSIGNVKPAGYPIGTSGERSRLPDIDTKTQFTSNLTDLKEECKKHDTKSKPTKANQHQQHNQSLPFFRENMLVMGHGQARSKAYTY